MNQVPSFREFGLLWDEPNMTDQEYLQALKGSPSVRQRWALARLLDRAPLSVVCELLTLREIRQALSEVKIRPQMRKAWEHAVQYWTQTT